MRYVFDRSHGPSSRSVRLDFFLQNAIRGVGSIFTGRRRPFSYLPEVDRSTVWKDLFTACE